MKIKWIGKSHNASFFKLGLEGSWQTVGYLANRNGKSKNSPVRRP